MLLGLWEYEVDAAPEGMPAVYEVGGREFVVFRASAQVGLTPARQGEDTGGLSGVCAGGAVGEWLGPRGRAGRSEGRAGGWNRADPGIQLMASSRRTCGWEKARFVILVVPASRRGKSAARCRPRVEFEEPNRELPSGAGRRDPIRTRFRAPARGHGCDSEFSGS